MHNARIVFYLLGEQFRLSSYQSPFSDEKDTNMISALNEELGITYDMKNLGPIRQILGMHVYIDKQAMVVSREVCGQGALEVQHVEC